ncbi:hypothetical protein Tco_0882487 [Tanacetum coccineum]
MVYLTGMRQRRFMGMSELAKFGTKMLEWVKEDVHQKMRDHIYKKIKFGVDEKADLKRVEQLINVTPPKYMAAERCPTETT